MSPSPQTSHDPGIARMVPFNKSIFDTMTTQAARYDAINLGQGYPDHSGPESMLQMACEQIAAGNNQYAPPRGVAELREAIARERNERYDAKITADNVLVTVGATEAIAASVLGLVEPGDEVIVFEPYYDAYAASIALADATRVPVALRLDTETGHWDIDREALAAAVTDKTVAIMVNNPHNPTGSVFSEQGLQALADIAIDNNLWVIADEVYEHLIFDGHHTPIAGLPGMRERTISISSAAKTLCVTGWKTGWAIAEPALLNAVARAKQYLSFVGTTPTQPAIAHALNNEQDWIADMVHGLEERKNHLRTVLSEIGFTVYDSQGTYFLLVDVASKGFEDGMDFCMRLPEIAGVAAIPAAAFCDDPELCRTLVRFAFSKSEASIDEAARRLRAAFA
ncbi:aminotransferase class I/II-fold pyridoxal phosphate-dependent enzyme [Corynebacterium sp. TAE3-ERU2]|uniref:aminotransferase class I/II-fold pyridoxal phosphate-dependent enzyme n=1 Tax=Corynebacterium sp. TAE3-ERU2 TaxID=2849497 RepID=UPI001C46A35E|nr:aminotransferase class I/II-fold pyridoxal phosphate-dependent enzyme [Corynebacterium sp. TAE3-ERU2]MBV7301960.1 aminotransferase class I/II-fold pyridoxal phosphate-dependent enzyme [Corynebacterium sp. TAE3-ERU2]